MSKKIPLPIRLWRKVETSDKPDACWNWTACKNGGGYGILRHEGRNLAPHRIIYEWFYGEIPRNKPFICHKCDNPACVRPSHLWAGSPADNVRDMSKKGRSARGDKNGTRLHPEKLRIGESVNTSKLTLDEVKEIIKIYSKGEVSKAELSRQYRVTDTQIGYIVRGISWKKALSAPITDFSKEPVF